jgi:hypothetical protein
VRERVVAQKRTVTQKRKKWRLDSLKDKEGVTQFQNEMKRNLAKVKEFVDVEDEWDQIEQAIKETADKVLGEERKIRNKGWFDDECKMALEEKNSAWKRMNQRRTRKTCSEYKELRKKADKIMKKKKRQMLKRNIEKIEELHEQNEVRQCFIAVNKIKTGYIPRLGGCKDKAGNIITEEKKMIERWAEYFQELLSKDEGNENESDDLDGQKALSEDKEEMTNEPSREEVEETIRKMKNNRSPGEDSIVAELIKCGGKELIIKIHELINNIWRNEVMPEKWKTGIICPIHKKGDKLLCGNYRGITLLNVVYKILSGVISKRLTVFAERILGRYQCGFRPNKSTTDQVFTIRQMMEKFYEHGTDIHFLFIDFQQAFDSINRRELMKTLIQLQIPPKLVRLVGTTLRETRARVKVQNKISAEFKFNTGVKQGDGLSAVLFNLALHKVVEAIDLKGTIFEKSSQICAYADDIAIAARRLVDLKQNYVILKRECNRIGLKININKTKYMVMSTVQSRRETQELITIDGDTFQGVSSFTYLGALITSDNNLRRCIQERIEAGNRSFYANLKLFRNRLISRSLKMKLYIALVRPVVTYCSETWTMTVADEERLRTFERYILRRIYGPVFDQGDWRIRYNEEIEQLIEGKNIVRFIKAQRIRWMGHVERMSEEEIPKRMVKGRLFKGRRQGRPKSRWMDQITCDLGKMGVRGWREKAANRTEWGAVVQQAKAHTGL